MAPDDKPAAKADAKATTKATTNTPPEPLPWYRTLRADPPTWIRLLLGTGFVGLVMLLWWLVTHGEPTERVISPTKMPSPGDVFGSWNELKGGSLSDNIVASLARVFKGILLASIVGITLGVLGASLRSVSAALMPIVIFLRSVPMGALLPIFLALFATGEKQKVMFIFFAVVPFVFSDTFKAIATVPERYVETAKTLGASNFQIVRKVLVPLALPDIVTSLRFMVGLALGYIVLAEAVAAEHGLGRMLMNNERLGLIEHNYFLLFVIALLAFAIDFGLRFFQRGIFPWRSDL